LRLAQKNDCGFSSTHAAHSLRVANTAFHDPGRPRGCPIDASGNLTIDFPHLDITTILQVHVETHVPAQSMHRGRHVRQIDHNPPEPWLEARQTESQPSFDFTTLLIRNIAVGSKHYQHDSKLLIQIAYASSRMLKI
jgi:hypothetical protein